MNVPTPYVMKVATPLDGDVIIRRHPRGWFTLGLKSGIPEVGCRSLREALNRAGSFAHPQARVWWTVDDRTFRLIGGAGLLRTIWNEYAEMPGLRLTCQQALRLWSLDADTGAGLLERLVEIQFLTRSADGKYGRAAEPGADSPFRRVRAAAAPRRAAARRAV